MDVTRSTMNERKDDNNFEYLPENNGMNENKRGSNSSSRR
jgi:hypothetical protein